MPLYALKPAPGAKKRRKIVGRGSGSGHGKTSTRGSNGQGARAGRDFYLGFEGGQSPLIRRIPKRGFTHLPRIEYQLINLRNLARFHKDSVIDPKAMEDKGLIRNARQPVKILGDGQLDKPLTVVAHKFSKSALEKIEMAGGKAEVLNDKIPRV